jgi:hypothetical protein
MNLAIFLSATVGAPSPAPCPSATAAEARPKGPQCFVAAGGSSGQVGQVF